MIDVISSLKVSSPVGEQDSEKCPEKEVLSIDVAQTQISDPKEIDTQPNGGYGWVCVACVFWINAHTWGINSVGTLPVERG